VPVPYDLGMSAKLRPRTAPATTDRLHGRDVVGTVAISLAVSGLLLFGAALAVTRGGHALVACWVTSLVLDGLAILTGFAGFQLRLSLGAPSRRSALGIGLAILSAVVAITWIAVLGASIE
jgi:hypothetical protein